jgi:D-alanine-D-alanine ligase
MRVLVLFGGRSGEHEVSVSSARSVTDALRELGHTPVPVGITRQGRWVRTDPHASERVNEEGTAYRFSPDPYARRTIDVVFPVLHGPFGEDGSLQGLFELANIPYVGSGVEGSAIGLNKWVHRQLFSQAGLPVVETLIFEMTAWLSDPDGWAGRVAREIGFPCFTKPAHLGSSVGITRVSDVDGLGPAMKRAFTHDDVVLVEAFGGSREIEVGVLEGVPPLVSVPGEAVPKGDFYDYGSKYTEGGTDLRIPAAIPGDLAVRINDYAARAFGAARAEGFARVDFMWEPHGDRLVVNEINTIPGLTQTSMFPKVWEASGKPFPEVVQHLLDHALRRHAKKLDLEAAREASHDAEIGAL